MKKILLMLALLSGGMRAQGPSAMREIDAEELLMEMHENIDLWVVNVLGRSLHCDCHIPGSINVPLRVLHKEMLRWDKDQPIVVYCALDECDASEQAYEMLLDAGFSDVRAYEGGIRDWYLKGLPSSGPCTYEYLKKCDCMGKAKIDPKEFGELSGEC